MGMKRLAVVAALSLSALAAPAKAENLDQTEFAARESASTQGATTPLLLLAGLAGFAFASRKERA
ncbi:MAG: hypothetical protein VX640_13145 [Pseudomonadota bacterium]|nr:hypothetical protein [Pseudomonadota bacterium]